VRDPIDREDQKPNLIDHQKWEQHKAVVQAALEHMAAYLQNNTEEEKDALRDLRYQLQQLQNTYRNLEWGPVRIVESSKTLLVEQAVECLLSPQDSAFWAYRTARTYAERYNSRYGTRVSFPNPLQCWRILSRFDIAITPANQRPLERTVCRLDAQGRGHKRRARKIPA
jgi:hypothetical protein